MHIFVKTLTLEAESFESCIERGWGWQKISLKFEIYRRGRCITAEGRWRCQNVSSLTQNSGATAPSTVWHPLCQPRGKLCSALRNSIEVNGPWGRRKQKSTERNSIRNGQIKFRFCVTDGRRRKKEDKMGSEAANDSKISAACKQKRSFQ